MARFEMTISNGERILVDHAATGMPEILSQLGDNPFLLFSEVKGGSSAPAREVIVASSQITLVRALDGHTTQSSTFISKR